MESPRQCGIENIALRLKPYIMVKFNKIVKADIQDVYLNILDVCFHYLIELYDYVWLQSQGTIFTATLSR